MAVEDSPSWHPPCKAGFDPRACEAGAKNGSYFARASRVPIPNVIDMPSAREFDLPYTVSTEMSAADQADHYLLVNSPDPSSRSVGGKIKIRLPTAPCSDGESSCIRALRLKCNCSGDSVQRRNDALGRQSQAAVRDHAIPSQHHGQQRIRNWMPASDSIWRGSLTTLVRFGNGGGRRGGARRVALSPPLPKR